MSVNGDPNEAARKSPQPWENGIDDGGDTETAEGDYSTRLEELLGDEQPDEPSIEDEDDGFVYTGQDADENDVEYGARMRDVMGSESISESDSEGFQYPTDDEQESREVEQSLVRSPTPSTSPSVPTTPPRIDSPSNFSTPSKPARMSLLNPAISRLRSFTPQQNAVPSQAAGLSPSPSRFSVLSMSRMSSVSNLRDFSSAQSNTTDNVKPKALPEREVFRWSLLKNISHHLYASAAQQKASSLLGTPAPGSPTVLAANGLICVGTREGRICVYDFKQTLKCICGTDSTAKTCGPVTALALSYDHTYVAAGHATGHIQLYDLSRPESPARHVSPTTLSVVASGRKEGHIVGSRIVSIGFIAGRHTAIVSADEHGLAFYHSLGKVLFVEAVDILRILGKYPLDGPSTPSAKTAVTPVTPSRKKRSRYTILGMMPLPLGTVPHPTDPYNIIALLTPTKLVMVGLKPTPKTWFKCSCEANPRTVKSRWKGTLAWFPSVPQASSGKPEPLVNGKSSQQVEKSLPPVLAYSWGNSLHLLRLSEERSKQEVKSSRTGKTVEVELGTITYINAGKWMSEDDILSLQWLNANQILLVTAKSLEVYDLQPSKIIERVDFNGLALVSLSSSLRSDEGDVGDDIAHSVRTYKGKIFTLGKSSVQVGTLLTWADRILSFVQEGDFLSAIELTRSYYLGTAPGNSNGLPDDPSSRKEVIGNKMRELMVASCRYAFSEDRMTDGTHVTPDGRGVDRTDLFEGLVSTCCRACVALNDTEFLFEDLFQAYDDAGIHKIFLRQLEPFVLENEIRLVPPRITQRLVVMHDEDGRPDHLERLVWHIDPACLDINQSIQLCERHNLYDALIYVYTRALKDYVAPVVKLLGLIRRIFQYRRSEDTFVEESDMESMILNAYKVYPYLGNVLAGLTYPSEEPLDEEEAFEAKRSVYNFLFFGRSFVWPAGEGGKLVLTADEDGGIEPTYPYARQLLRFDAESFLHSLDIAFEDPYLNEESQAMSRSVIVRILLEISSSDTVSPSDVTFVNIFVARNVPKYPQYLQELPLSALHGIIVKLAEDVDQNTREDRQLAAEYLLSVYSPHEMDRIVALFEAAGFYRILRRWHRQDHKWGPLLSTYLDDPDLRPLEVFENVSEVLEMSKRANKGFAPKEVLTTISNDIRSLLQTSIISTASLLDVHAPNLHETALNDLDEDQKRFIYLRHLLGPPRLYEDEFAVPLAQRTGPSLNVKSELREKFISLHCQYSRGDIIETLKYLPPGFLNLDDAVKSCEKHEVFDAVVWVANQRGDPRDALDKAETFEKKLTLKIAEKMSSEESLSMDSVPAMQIDLESLRGLGSIGVDICVARSQDTTNSEIPLEDIWFQLLSSQINMVQNISACCSTEGLSEEIPKTDSGKAEQQILSILRVLVQETFSSLVSVSSTRAVSFPRLFKRLVNSAPQTSSGTQYTEFRTILTGMLESYRSEGDMLVITKQLVDHDLFDTVEEATRERAHGWRPAGSICINCRKPLLRNGASEAPTGQIVISRTGTLYHTVCVL